MVAALRRQSCLAYRASPQSCGLTLLMISKRGPWCECLISRLGLSGFDAEGWSFMSLPIVFWMCGQLPISWGRAHAIARSIFNWPEHVSHLMLCSKLCVQMLLLVCGKQLLFVCEMELHCSKRHLGSYYFRCAIFCFVYVLQCSREVDRRLSSVHLHVVDLFSQRWACHVVL